MVEQLKHLRKQVGRCALPDALSSETEWDEDNFIRLEGRLSFFEVTLEQAAEEENLELTRILVNSPSFGEMVLDLKATLVLGQSTHVAAENDRTYIMSVHDLIHEEAESDGDGVKVQVRGYLSSTGNMILYPTKDQAIIDDHISGVIVGDADDGFISTNCLQSYVVIVARIIYLEPRVITLSPTKVTTLTLDENGHAKRNLCWAAKD